MERVADPTVVAALFSMILAMRNRLHAMGQVSVMITFSDKFILTRYLHRLFLRIHF